MFNGTSAPRRGWPVWALAGAVLILSGIGVGAALGHGSHASAVTIKETDFKLSPSQHRFAAGTYAIHVLNKSPIVHSFVISGPGVSRKTLAHTLQPGKGATLTVTLKPGTYTLWCPIDHHAQHGMKMTIVVPGASSTPTTTTAPETSTSATWG